MGVIKQTFNKINVNKIQPPSPIDAITNATCQFCFGAHESQVRRCINPILGAKTTSKEINHNVQGWLQQTTKLNISFTDERNFIRSWKVIKVDSIC